MPFTPAHAIAALPFRKTRLNLTALVAGCMSPDFTYFLHLTPYGKFGHTLVGVFKSDLPWSLLVLWLYLRFVRSALIAAAPGLFPLREGERAADEPQGVAGWLTAAVSILLGAATHIVWDSFTHTTFSPYAHFQWMHLPVALFVHRKMELYKVLQYLSSFLGVGVLLLLWFRWVRARRTNEALIKALGVGLIALAALGSMVRVVVGRVVLHQVDTRNGLLATGVVTVFALLWWELVLTGMVMRVQSTQA